MTANLSILLVDDDSAVCDSMRMLLEMDGYAVETRGSAREAIEAITGEPARRFDLVITDLAMPDGDGYRVAAAVREASPDTPVILLTGWGQQISADPKQAALVNEVLGKPARLSELRKAIDRCLKR